MSDARFQNDRFMIRKKVFKIFGNAFHIYDENGQVFLYSKLKAFKLKEDIRVYTGEDMTTEVLTIQARSILDFGAAYDIVDPLVGEKVGAMKRKALKSFLQDEWIIMDAQDQEIGVAQEDSMPLALVRRFLSFLSPLLSNLVPQSFHGEVGGAPVFYFKRHFNPFVLRMDMDFSVDAESRLDRRLGIAAAILLSAIEGRQN